MHGNILNRRVRALLLSLTLVGFLGNMGLLAQATDVLSAKLDEFLSQGQLEESSTYFSAVVKKAPDDQQARLALGMTRFLHALEQLGQANYRCGLLGNRVTARLPIARLPIPTNPEPKAVSYEQFRAVLQDFQMNLLAAGEVLSEIDTSEVKLQLFPGRVRLDLDGDGNWHESETLWRIFREVNNGVRDEQGVNFQIGWDGADVHWLRGYIHVLAGICDCLLAFDERDLFEHCGHLVFDRIETPFLVPQETSGNRESFDIAPITDLIAAIHLMRFKLVDKARMAAAHQHFLEMIRESRLSWKLILAETDNDHEWLPSPTQTSVLGVSVGDAMITSWTAVMDEIEAILLGKKLIPYWRDYAGTIFGNRPKIPAQGRGINLQKFFLEPRDFDFVLALQGTAVEPYLEIGELSTPDAWNRLTGVFRGQFFGFAVWFN